MPKRLADVEAERRAAERNAKRWMARNARKLPPETLPGVRTDGAAGPGERIQARQRTWSFTRDENEVQHSEGGRFMPLVGQQYELNLASVALSARVYRALMSLPVKQRELLLGHYVERLTLRQLNPRASKQATHESVQWAKKALLRALLAQADTALVLRLEDF